MNILLIHPSTNEELYFRKILGLVTEPIGLEYIAASLDSEKHEIDIIDLRTDSISEKELIKTTNEKEVDIVGIYLATYKAKSGLNILKKIKKHDKEIKTVCGGPHSSLKSKEIIKKSYVDFVVFGEGERSFPKLVKCLEENEDLHDIEGITFKNSDEIVENDAENLIKDLDSIPFPDRRHIKPKNYRLMNSMTVSSIISSRGCPFCCNYCTTPAIFGKELRTRSAFNVVEEIEEINKKYDTDLIMFLDDNFALKEDRIWDICDEIDERNLDITWGCASGGFSDVDEGLIKRMKQTGFRVVNYNLDTGSKKSIENMDRDLSLKEAKEELKRFEEFDLVRILNIVLGFPGEDKEDIKESIELAKDIGAEFPLFFLPTPYPGTDFYETAKRQNLIKELNWEKYNTYNPVLESEYLDIEEIKELYNQAYKETYLNKKIFKKQIKSFLNSLKDGWVEPHHIPKIIYQGIKSRRFILQQTNNHSTQ
ncbi:MAG: Radical SAM superfamily enzyme [Candidatus Methanohalarchaeum thermophilum]|uniref:Radical SAM superfamily enzyme n=1 Tax=Methanohalarchaeum thermophilum TaxID=1903181 RepID=A0A1Q6DTN1_METT1|nr:MAG: Radical SAM superfamily enzyme [Candidatus Methanohalarchaeum thermophilum]